MAFEMLDNLHFRNTDSGDEYWAEDQSGAYGSRVRKYFASSAIAIADRLPPVEFTEDEFYLAVQNIVKDMGAASYRFTGEKILERWIDKVTKFSHRIGAPAVIVEITKGDGTKTIENRWAQNGNYHRLDGPAQERSDDSLWTWYKHGNMHCETGPAAKDASGTLYWYENGVLHRTDGPAIVLSDGTSRAWYLNGRCLSEDDFKIQSPDAGLVKTEEDDSVCWRTADGLLHRTAGPAVIYSDGSKEYYRNGIPHNEDGPAVCDADGSYEHYVDGEYHRIGGPAVHQINDDDSFDDFYYTHGVLHREDGPAIIEYDLDGDIMVEEYYLDGEAHRTDGPACVDSEGNKAYFVMGQEISEEDFLSGCVKIVDKDSASIWFVLTNTDTSQSVLLHNEDGPALISDTKKCWYQSGLLHRVDGPAVVHDSGEVEYWVDGEQLSKESFDEFLEDIKELYESDANDGLGSDDFSFDDTDEIPTEPLFLLPEKEKMEVIQVVAPDRAELGQHKLVVPQSEDLNLGWVAGGAALLGILAALGKKKPRRAVVEDGIKVEAQIEKPEYVRSVK